MRAVRRSEAPPDTCLLQTHTLSPAQQSAPDDKRFALLLSLSSPDNTRAQPPCFVRGKPAAALPPCRTPVPSPPMSRMARSFVRRAADPKRLLGRAHKSPGMTCWRTSGSSFLKSRSAHPVRPLVRLGPQPQAMSTSPSLARKGASHSALGKPPGTARPPFLPRTRANADLTV